MKKFNLLIVIGLLVSTIAYSQNMNGKVTLGGSLSYYKNTQEIKIENNQDSNPEQSTSELTIIPRLGYFLSENLQLGIGLIITNRNQKNNESEYYMEYEYDELLYGFNPSLRYFQPIVEDFGFWGEFNVAIGFGSEKDILWNYNPYTGTSTKNETKYGITLFHIDINPGLYYYVSNNFYVDLSIGGIYYTSESKQLEDSATENNPKYIQKNYGFDFSLQSISVGVHYIF